MSEPIIDLVPGLETENADIWALYQREIRRGHHRFWIGALWGASITALLFHVF